MLSFSSELSHVTHLTTREYKAHGDNHRRWPWSYFRTRRFVARPTEVYGQGTIHILRRQIFRPFGLPAPL